MSSMTVGELITKLSTMPVDDRVIIDAGSYTWTPITVECEPEYGGVIIVCEYG